MEAVGEDHQQKVKEKKAQQRLPAAPKHVLGQWFAVVLNVPCAVLKKLVRKLRKVIAKVHDISWSDGSACVTSK